MKKVILMMVAVLAGLAFFGIASALGFDVTPSATLGLVGVGMATNYIQEGDVVDLVAPYAVSAGDGAQVGSLFGVAVNDLLISVEGPFATSGVFDLAKTSAQAWTVGQKIYWDNSNKRCDSDSTVGILIGVATAVASNPSSTGYVRLNESVADAAEGPQAAVADLTENSGAIGGTNDGDLPDLTATAAALTENSGAIGGTNDGDLPDLTATAAALTENSGAIGGTNDGDLPALVNPAGDAGASVIAGIRENATAINELVADNVALRAAIRENAAAINELVADNVALRAAIRENAAKENATLAKLRLYGVIAAA